MRWILIFLEWFVDWARGTYWYLVGKRSSLCKPIQNSPGFQEVSRTAKDGVLKQGFSRDAVPANLDVIVIGSGLGGLTAAALLAKLGKRVLVLEQMDQAGGLCQSFNEKGFDFDMAFHNLGQVHENSLLKVTLDQITDGRLKFVELEPHVDTVVIGRGQASKKYTIYSGKRNMEAHLKKQFPNDAKAVEKLFKIMKICTKKIHMLCMLKLIPLWFARLILCTGIVDWISPIFKYSRSSTEDVLNSLTSNNDLKTVFCHFFSGPSPKNTSCMLNAVLFHHYKRGAFYPRGGVSEIPYHIIGLIQRHGGKVMVQAPISQILLDNGVACGVTVNSGGEEVSVHAPVIISDAGVFNTFQKLLPPEIQAQPEIMERLQILKLGKAFFQVFVGFNSTQEELEINSTNYRFFKNDDIDAMADEYFASSQERAPDRIPMMYVSFPSAKDPGSKDRFPGQTCMVIHSIVKYEWFEQWKDLPASELKAYEDYKMRFANNLFDWACEHFPKLKDKVAVIHAVSPINMHGLRALRGAMLSADHNLERDQPMNIAKNRSSTPVKNLYLTGQDVFSCGYSGAVHGGIICASTVVDHALYIDLMLHKRKLKEKASKKLD
ncbi:inactive all-trans-retinol 13,14-reductase-like [Triplophysa dalaica]|uniref:inactive all-trans-retinol 13,14-reductase-like n=1 Tax=Triplophysa dalaica TaxID=1582913 RepID=UPI0024E03081|nr:inactive all-trans-retinol 13,14-reductase-like [Triplophysa dalaica]